MSKESSCLTFQRVGPSACHLAKSLPLPHKARVLHISASCDPIGGIGTYIRQITDSPLASEFEFASTHYPCVRWGHVGALRTLARTVRAFAPDLVHVHGLQVEGVNGVLAARMGNCSRIVVTIHGFMEDSLARSSRKRSLVARFIEPWALILSSAFYCVSAYGETKWVVRRYARKSLGKINNALPITPTSASVVSGRHLSKEGCRALFVGRVTRDKGVFDLLPVLAEARESSGVDIRLTLVGDGPDLSAFQNMAESKGQAAFITCVGKKSNPAPYYEDADVFILPSYHEHQSYSILEAMRAGLPVLAYDTGGNGELVATGVTGRLSPLGATRHMGAQLAELATEYSLRRALGMAGLARLTREFGCNRFLDEVASVYRVLLGNPK